MRIIKSLTLLLLLTMAFYGCNKESNAPKEINSDLPSIYESNDKGGWIYINESDDMIEPKDLYSALDSDIAGYDRSKVPPEDFYEYLEDGKGSKAADVYEKNDRVAIIIQTYDSEDKVYEISNRSEFEVFGISNGNMYAKRSSNKAAIRYWILIKNRILIDFTGVAELVPEDELESIVRSYDVARCEKLVD